MLNLSHNGGADRFNGGARATTNHEVIMLDPGHASPYASAASAELSAFEAAARYALLQRLAPAIRHDMLGTLQSMGMLAAMIERRLQSANPDLASIRQDCASLDIAARTAASSSINLMSWIAPKGASTVKVDAGVQECLGLLSTQLRFKGFVIVNEVSGIDAELSSAALRSVLSATLIALSDHSGPPADLLIRAQALPDRVEFSIELRPTEARVKNFRLAESRLLSWREVEILASAESVELALVNGGAQLSFRRAGAS